jgi:hypothetical protein
VEKNEREKMLKTRKVYENEMLSYGHEVKKAFPM